MSVNVITTKGKQNIADLQADPGNVSLDFLSVYVGSGTPTDLSPAGLAAMTDLVSTKKQGAINFVRSLGGGQYEISISFDNIGVVEGFSATEIEIRAKDPENPANNYLFLYSYEEQPSYMPPGNSELVEHSESFIFEIVGVSNPIITIVSSANINRTDFYEDNTIIVADTAENPVIKTVAPGRLIGRGPLGTDVIEDLEKNVSLGLLGFSFIDGVIAIEENE